MLEKTIEELKKSIFDYKTEEAVRISKRALEEKIDPLLIMEALTEAIRKIGDDFSANKLWLPDLVGAAKAMEAASSVIEAEIQSRGIETKNLGTVVIGTVFGDIHSIGKTMVSTMLKAAGFYVQDLGVNISATEFLDAVRNIKPDILAMSALMTTTAPEQRKVINSLVKEGLRQKVRVIVGGGALTKDFANDIGADGYEPTAPGAAKLALKLIGG
ncbi:MAG: cobalamin-dependent protein [Actinobacteria bacterium]|nr:cobalamin-dependent protein [Actinomycetota bacterium]